MKPYEETASLYLLGFVTFILSLLALDRLTIITALYPFVLMAMNGVMVAVALGRRSVFG